MKQISDILEAPTYADALERSGSVLLLTPTLLNFHHS